MLEFVSLFLGLTWGVQEIELVATNPAIVQVEVLLDGELEKRLDAPPWKTSVDLGSLEPHRLAARGLDAAGRELARAEQWINVPRPPAEARLVIEQDAAGRKTHALLSWESVSGNNPRAVEIQLDGVKLEPADFRRIELPPLDPKELHFLSAELVFPDTSTAHAEASFGGVYGDEVETELTAFPVRTLKKKAPLTPLYDCFQDAGGRSLRVAQVERETAEVLFVRDRGLEPVLARLRVIGSFLPSVEYRGLRTRSASTPDALRYELRLEPDDRVRFVWPLLLPSSHPHFRNMALFESSPILTARDGGIFYFLTRLYPEKADGPQHLADAVALAGLRAAAGGRRRAVVLVLGEETPEEHSIQTAAAAQAFLRAMRVPLLVWGKSKGSGQNWPESQAIESPGLVARAFRILEAELDRQRIVWISGRHLASEIRFDAARCPDFAPLLEPLPATKVKG